MSSQRRMRLLKMLIQLCGKKTLLGMAKVFSGKTLKKKPDYLVTLIIFPLTPTHQPPKDDIWQKWLSVRKFTTHPPWRNNEIFLKKKGVLIRYFCNLSLGPSLKYWHFREHFQKNKAWLRTMLQNFWPLGLLEGLKYNPQQFCRPWNTNIHESMNVYLS